MFARPQRKKRSHGSNFSSSIGDNSSVGGSSELDGMEYLDNNGLSLRHSHSNLRNNVSLSFVNNGTGMRIVRRVQSNSSLRPSTTGYGAESLPQALTNPGQAFMGTRRSISGTYTPPQASRSPLTQKPQQPQQSLTPPQNFQPPAFPQNLAHFRSPRANSTFLNPSSSTDELLNVLNRANATPASLHDALNQLRLHILKHGLPTEDSGMDAPVSNSIRCRVWKVLLGVYHISAGEYLQLVAKGPSPMFDKVNNDTFRTLATDKKFLERVQEGMLVRVLNAQVWKTQSVAPGPTKSEYVQGMNVLVAPFLFVMPEVDAFFSSYTLLKVYCPTYVQPTLSGVHCGLKLMDKCLEVLDAELYFYLKSKGLTSELYAFASILTLSACTPPLDELLKIWDFLLAFGVHLNVICTVAQLMLMRQALMNSPSPVKLLRTFPDLQSNTILRLTRYLVTQLPSALYEELAAHTFDSAVCDRYGNDQRSISTNLFPMTTSRSNSPNPSRPLVGRK